MMKSLLQTAICIFSLVMALAYLPVSLKVSICMAMVFLINTNGLLSKFLKFVIPWKARLIISVCLVLIAISAAPRSSEYDQAGHINQIRADQKETEEMKKRVDYEI